jgi:hypothetical protein
VYRSNERDLAAVFVRAPHDPTDTVKVAWRPGQPGPPARDA